MDHRQNMRSYIGGLSSYDTADLFLVHWLEHFIISIDRTLLMHILMIHIGNKIGMHELPECDSCKSKVFLGYQSWVGIVRLIGWELSV